MRDVPTPSASKKNAMRYREVCFNCHACLAAKIVCLNPKVRILSPLGIGGPGRFFSNINQGIAKRIQIPVQTARATEYPQLLFATESSACRPNRAAKDRAQQIRNPMLL